ncbi:MAG: hypothetical protein QOH92_565 [Chloroflexota bacterium]|jgi:hypothetical protein|nr:hypothetical protein [Chloroflexota bacterium]
MPKTLSESRSRISAIVEPSTRSRQTVTKADLAFVDSAIQLYRAGTASLGKEELAVGIAANSPTACDPVDVAAAVVALAVLAYHVYNSCLIGGDSEVYRLAQRLDVAPTISLERLIESRNNLAQALDQEAI